MIIHQFAQYPSPFGISQGRELEKLRAYKRILQRNAPSITSEAPLKSTDKLILSMMLTMHALLLS
jgi:hypothetical protein